MKYKTQYIKHLKKLIKKYHPDLCRDEYLEKVYNEITIKLNDKLTQANAENKDMSYEYYKSGIKHYQNIHPGKFYKKNTGRTFEPKTYKE